MSKAQKMNEKPEKKEELKGYIYVMISTLNQMVNYIPLKHFTFGKIYNLTIDDSEYADNKNWDKNIKDVLTDKIEIEDIEFKQSEISDIESIKNTIEGKFKDKKVFWNITGGQRPFILAINQIAKEDDIICYLEGNKNQMVLLKNNAELNDIVNDYSLDDLTIETALKLMGFDVKITETSHRNLLKGYDKKEKEFYLDFLEIYIEDSKKDGELRENLITLNKNETRETKNAAKQKIKEKLKGLEYEKLDDELNKNIAFGYILEKLAGYKILDLVKDKIADITFGEKINYSNPDKKVDENHIDEFDIALLTKNGKFMIFECKSGGMSGDVAKSTKYSTYAISGAYGLPVLITPLLKKEIDNLNDLKDEPYKNIKSAVKAAKRSSLDVWGLDKIKEKLKKYIDF